MTPTPPSPPFTFPSCWNTLRCKRHWSEHARIWLLMRIAWENSQHLVTLPLVSRTNDAWETSAEIPYWWRVTTQILLVLLIGCAAWEIWFNQSFGREASGSVTKMLAVFSGYDEKKRKNFYINNFFSLQLIYKTWWYGQWQRYATWAGENIPSHKKQIEGRD